MPSIFVRRGRRGVTLSYLVDGRERMRQFPDEEAAQAFLRDANRAARIAAPLDRETTLQEYAERWFRQLAPTLRRASQRVYASYMDQHVLPALGAIPLRRLGRGQVKELLSGLLRAGLAKKTVSNVRGVLHACLESAVEDLPDVLAVNPAAFKSRGLNLSSSRAERRAKVKALTVPELQRFLAQAKGHPHYHALRFAAGTGVRPGEALGLRWEDLDLEAGLVLIRRAIAEGREQPTKTGHERQVDMGPALVDELRAWDAETKEQALAAGRQRSRWVFGIGPSPLRLRVLQDAFRAAGKAAKIAPWHSPHHLRHTYASQALAAGESIYYVQRQLGHTTVQMTVDLYGSWLPSGSQETAARIEAKALGEHPETAARRVQQAPQPYKKGSSNVSDFVSTPAQKGALTKPRRNLSR